MTTLVKIVKPPERPVRVESVPKLRPTLPLALKHLNMMAKTPRAAFSGPMIGFDSAMQTRRKMYQRSKHS